MKESASDQNPSNSQLKDPTLDQREGLDSLTEKDSTDSFKGNDVIRGDTKQHSQKAPRVETKQAEEPESQSERSSSEQAEKLDEGLKSNEEVFERIKNFKKIHGRLPDLDNPDEKREITGVKHQKENSIVTDQVTEDDFPSPFLKEELDADHIEEIFSSLVNNVKTTTVVYKSDEHGNVRVQKYTQTRHADGVYTTDIYEGTNEMSENQNAEEHNDAEQNYGYDEDQFFQNPEDFSQDSEDIDEGNKEDSSTSWLLYIHLGFQIFTCFSVCGI